MPKPDHSRWTPLAISDHELLHPIASGSYGEVWLALSAVGTSRAVKIVRRDSFERVEDFEREFKGLQNFEPVSRSHEGFVDILQIGRQADWFYYVMELADAAEGAEGMKKEEGRMQKPEGSQSAASNSSFSILPSALEHYAPRTLRHDLRTRGALTAEEVITLGLKLASALAHLHAQGLVHRDVKPSNILFVGGLPKLADAGLVAAMDDARSLVGTSGYIAPEGPGSSQADLYALGKVLYEAAFGKDRQDYPQLPSDVASRPDHARLLELNEVITKACAHDSHERYATAEAMHADLVRLQRGKSVRRQRRVEQAVRFARKALPIAVAAAAVATLLFLPRSNDSTVQRFNASTSATIFVLPFRNSATNSDDGGLRGRLTDAFINSLRLIDGITVAPRRSMLSERPELEARREAAKLFGVRYVLTGKSDMGTNTTLLLNLYETEGDRPVWSQSFTGTAERLVEMETQAIRALAKQVNAPITPDAEQRIGQKLSNNLAAWKLVQHADKVSLRARDDISATLQQYNEALQLDPDYAGALAGKAQFLRNQTGDRWPNEIWPEIKACGERMLQIDPTSSQGQYFLWITKFLFEWKWEDAEKMFQERRARRLDWPVMAAIYLRTVGRFDEARVEQEKVKGLDQRNLAVRNHSISAAFIERDYRKTIELALETQAMFPGSDLGSEWLFHGYYHLGQFEQALDASRLTRKFVDGPLWMALEACALAKTGQTEAARKFLSDLEAMSAHRYVDAYPLAWIHLALGDKAAALAKLRQAYQQRSEFIVFADVLAGGLRIDPKLDELRDEPEFQEILKLAGLDVWPKPARVK